MGQGFESLQARQKAAEKSAAANMVVVAQLVRVPGCGPGGRGFDSHQPPHLKTSTQSIFALRILISEYIGASSSGKTTDFDSVIRWFKSSRPSHVKNLFCPPRQKRFFTMISVPFGTGDISSI